MSGLLTVFFDFPTPIFEPLKTFGHAVMGKTMTLTEDRLAPTECGVGMVVLFIVTL